jgi:hypothetical protein
MIEKPPKYQEKVEIEATYFDIQIKLQQLRQAPYLPPEGMERPFSPVIGIVGQLTGDPGDL